MQHCQICETEHEDSLAVCPECEGDEKTVHYCKRCGEGFVASRACPACGTYRGSQKCERHPEQEASGRCVVCERALCSACAATSAPTHLCDEHRGVRVTEGWAEVYTTTNELEAQLVRDNLRAEGLDARTYSQRDSILSVDLGELSIVRVLVPVWSFRDARDLLREHTGEEGEVSFACPTCGEAFETGAVTCQACGAAIAGPK